jgi:ubiquinone/menaquinone biosynthesis C-methylase UbiE
MGRPRSILGIDPAEEPIKIAKEKIDKRNIEFSVHTAAHLTFTNDRFDIAYVRGVLHHMDSPEDAIHEALRAARHLVVIEPNGYNPGLKVIERLSQYHRQHGEKSYPPHRLNRWVRRNGGRIIKYKYAGFVPMFCPDWLAHILKRQEPAIEALPLIKNLGCAVFVFLAEKNELV